MKRIKSFDQLNEESNFFRNLLLSTALSLGLNSLDAQTVVNDGLKVQVIKDIYNYNKLVILSNDEDNLEKLKLSLSKKMENPDEFMSNYLQLLPDRTFVVKPNFVEGLNLYLRSNSFSIGYNIKF